MIYKEIKKDLFTVDDDYYLAHCIASDLRMGAGIAVPMNKKFGLRAKIKASGQKLKAPTCILTGKVFNLITKSKSGGKPTYKTLDKALLSMKNLAVIMDIKRIAMPKIGCGLDKLSWGKVREMTKEMFKDTDIEVLVCKN